MADATWPRTVEAYETSDGGIHRSRELAQQRQRVITAATLASELLCSGISLGQSLRRAGLLPADVLPELDEVYQSTQLVIPLWQCRDTPGYRPLHVTPDGNVYVWGDAGAWSGPYGHACSAREVHGWWMEMKERAARAKEQRRG